MNTKYYVAVTILFFASIYLLKPQTPAVEVADIPIPEVAPIRTIAAVKSTGITAAPASQGSLSSPAAPPTTTSNDVDLFLERSASLKHQLREDLPRLIQTATSIKVPDGTVVREEANNGEYQYKEMNTDSGATVKKIFAKERPISESYYDIKKNLSFAREFHASGALRSLSLRWSKQEAIQLTFHPEGQVAEMIEAVDGKAIKQKWDLNNNLITHTTSTVINGKFSEINHLAKAPQEFEPEMDEFEDGDTTEL